MLRLLSIICTALCRKKVHCDTLFSSIWTNINVENKFSKCRQNLIPTRQKWRNKRVSVASNRRISLGCLVWMTVQCCKYTVEIYLFIYLKVRFFLSLIGIHRQEGWISTLIPMSINGTVCMVNGRYPLRHKILWPSLFLTSCCHSPCGLFRPQANSNNPLSLLAPPPCRSWLAYVFPGRRCETCWLNKTALSGRNWGH